MHRSIPGSRSKAQISIEFMMLFIFFVGLLAVVMVYAVQNMQSVSSSTLSLEAGKTLSLALSKLDTAFLEGDGFSTTFVLPGLIMGMDYSVNVTSGFVLVVVDNSTYSRPLLTKDVAGMPKKGENAVRNANGTLVIS